MISFKQSSAEELLRNFRSWFVLNRELRIGLRSGNNPWHLILGTGTFHAMNSLPVTMVLSTDLAPNHSEIAQCARDLWMNSGRPAEIDDEIWLEAERRLIAAKRAPLPMTGVPHTLSRYRAHHS